MSVPKKSLTGKHPPTEAHSRPRPTNPGTDNSPLLKGVKTMHAGPGMTWINLTRKDVEEKLSKYRQQQAATNQGSLWRRLANAIGKLRKSD